jgi:predicted solute-binding protein
MIENLRIGSVPYLNAKPLVRYLPAGLHLQEPSRLADEFRNGLLDVALIPVVECFLEKNVRVIDGVAIACQGPVYSVILAHEKPVKELKNISLDAASLTSATLLKVLLQKQWKINPDLLQDGFEADGQLLIGDRALKFRRDFPKAQITDLGSAWRGYTGLPFVFAVWAVNPACTLSAEQALFFRELCLKGLAERGDIAQTPEEYQYLTDWIRFGLGPFEKEGVKRFAKEIKELSLFPDFVETPLEYI